MHAPRVLRRLLVVPSAALVAALSVLPSAPVQAHVTTYGGVSPQGAELQDVTPVHFVNSTASTVSLAVVYHDDTGVCEPWGGYVSEGWWTIEPGKEKYVINTSRRVFYWYAYTTDGKTVWQGTALYAWTKNSRFRLCLLDSGEPAWTRRGFRASDIGPVHKPVHRVRLTR